MDSAQKKISKANLGQLMRFGIVGVGATLTHLCVAILLIKAFSTPPLLANLIAFLMAFIVSFGGHYIWTFSRPGHHGRAVVRFFVTAFSGFLTNTVVLAALLRDGRLTEVQSLIIAVTIIPVVTYLISRFWAFKASP